MKNPALAYRQSSVRGATPLGLVVMLYDGAIGALRRAVTAIEARNVQEKCAQLNRALAIIAQLEGTLDMENGGEVAQTLKTLYVHARQQIIQANLQNSTETLTKLAQELGTVREAWYQVDHPAPSPPQPNPGGDAQPNPSPPSRLPSLGLRA